MIPLNNILSSTSKQYQSMQPTMKYRKNGRSSGLLKAPFLLRGKEDETVESIYGKSAIYAEFGKVVCISVGLIQGNSEGKNSS